MKILLVDDDIELLDITAYALQRCGHTVVVAKDGPQAINTWRSERPDIVVLDVGLPSMSGMDVCQTIREESTIPVIFLSGRNSEKHVIKGLQLGADDYIVKPFSARELTVRIEAICRRAHGKAEPELPRHLSIGGLQVDIDSHEVHRPDGEIVRLTPIEFRILQTLIIHAPRVVSNERLADYAWKYDGGDISLLKTHISHIRTKLDLARFANSEIVSITGVGYRLSSTEPAMTRELATFSPRREAVLMAV